MWAQPEAIDLNLNEGIDKVMRGDFDVIDQENVLQDLLWDGHLNK